MFKRYGWKIYLLVSAVLISLAVTAAFFFSNNVQGLEASKAEENRNKTISQPLNQPNLPAESQEEQLFYKKIETTEHQPVLLEYPKVKGIYIPPSTVRNKEKFDQLVKLVEETELNAVVIDIKDDRGQVFFPVKTPLREIGVDEKTASNYNYALAKLAEKKIFIIGRIVVFKDPVLTQAKSELAIKTKAGEVWQDHKGVSWMDPYCKEVWDDVAEIALKAASLGFREIQFDYVRFPTDGPLKYISFPRRDQRSKPEVIAGFLQYAKEKLSPYQIRVSADIFGLTTTLQGDMGIGQEIERIAAVVDIICPMVYPSHYGMGNYGLIDPDAEPYQTVYRALRDGVARTKTTGVIIRPWLQDFTLRNQYGPQQVQEQIKATYDAGLDEWLLWNSKGIYSTDALVKIKN